MKFTVLGAKGFIGSNLTKYLRRLGHNVFTPSLNDILSGGHDLNCVFYCIGLTGDFRSRPMDTVEAHVSLLLQILRSNYFRSFLYLSSTRVYQGASKAVENTNISVRSDSLDYLYDLSKLMGESLCLNCGFSNMHIVRLSNVVGNNEQGSNNFLSSVINDALYDNHVTLHSSLQSSKDYIHIDDVVNILPKIIKLQGNEIYNIGYGKNITHKQIIDRVSSITKCTYDVIDDPPLIVFPKISIEKIKQRFDFKPVNIIDALPKLIEEMKER